MDNDIVVFDIGTTGFEGYKNEINELVALRIHNGLIQESCHYQIRPEQGITSKTKTARGIYEEEHNCEP